MRALFITGTDTGVGKTVVTCAIARAATARGHAVAVCKPVATGAEWDGARWVCDDTRRLAAAAGTSPPPEEVTRWTFREPAAPPVAARAEGAELHLGAIAAEVRRHASPEHLLLVEGVGGLLCPLTERETVGDLVAVLGFPLIVVTRRSLGTLNHTLLTLEVARGRGLDVRGVVVNETEPPRSLAALTNLEELCRRCPVPVLGRCGFGPIGDPDDRDLRGIDWWELAARRTH